MRYKVAPDPRDGLDTLAEAHRAVPLVPSQTDDCCARLQSRLDLATRDDAPKWLTFLTALELIRETDRGYKRERTDLDPATLGVAFREGIFGAREVLDVLGAEEPVPVETVFGQVREIVPTWERHRHEDWEREWRERVRQLVEWAVHFELAQRRADGYMISER